MATFRINEDDFKYIVESASRKILENTENIDEGFFDNIKSAISGAKKGYNTQNALDKNIDTDYKMNTVSKGYPRFDKTKEDVLDSIKEYLKMSKEYLQYSNSLRNKANALAKKYNISLNGQGYDKTISYNIPMANIPQSGKKFSSSEVSNANLNGNFPRNINKG